MLTNIALTGYMEIEMINDNEGLMFKDICRNCFWGYHSDALMKNIGEKIVVIFL